MATKSATEDLRGSQTGATIDARTVLVVIALLWAQALGSTVSTLSWLGLVAWSVTGPAAAVRALLLGVLLLLLNPALFSSTPLATELRWMLLLAAGLCVIVNTTMRIARTRTSRLPMWAYALAAFGALSAVLALNFSYAPAVSLLKLGAFLWGFATVHIGVTHTRRQQWLQWLYSVWFAILVSSLPLIASPFGYWRNGTGFQGIMVHPQTYGVITAPFIAYLTAWLLLNGLGRRPATSVVAAAGWATLFLSMSRTAVLSVILALSGTIIYAALARPDIRGRLARRIRSPGTLAAITIMSAVLSLYIGHVGDAVGGFLAKGRQIEGDATAGTIAASVQHSRGPLLESQWANIREHLPTGIGFGVASDANDLHIQRSVAFFNLPLGASVEKGFLPTAVIEENGIFAGLLFFVFLWLFARRVLRSYGAPSSALLLCAIALNAGEMVFFSAGALGIFIWLTMAVAANQPSDSLPTMERMAEAPKHGYA